MSVTMAANLPAALERASASPGESGLLSTHPLMASLPSRMSTDAITRPANSRWANEQLRLENCRRTYRDVAGFACESARTDSIVLSPPLTRIAQLTASQIGRVALQIAARPRSHHPNQQRESIGRLPLQTLWPPGRVRSCKPLPEPYGRASGVRLRRPSGRLRELR